MEYQHLKDCFLMIWEENPNKKNINNQIKFNLIKSITPKVGDVIKTYSGIYELTEIIECRQSSSTSYNYVTAKTKWYKI